MQEEILVTGASGYIGGHLAKTLIGSGRQVRLLVRDSQRLTGPLRASAEVIQGDLECPETLAAAASDVELVYHCAANVATWGNWQSYYQANVIGLENLLQAVLAGNKHLPRFIHISTVDVYGYPDLPCTESAPLACATFHYGKSKVLAEKLIRQYGQDYDLPYTILRPCNVIGPGSQFIERIGKELSRGLMMTINGGTCHAGLIYIDNLIDYFLRIAGLPEAVGECYNLREPWDTNWGTFLRDFKRGIAGKGLIINLPYGVARTIAQFFEKSYRFLSIDREPLLHGLLVDIFGRTCGHSPEKIIAACGCAESVSYEQAVERSCRWYLDHFAK